MFIDDQTKAEDHREFWEDSSSGKMEKLNLYQIRDLCPFGSLGDLIKQGAVLGKGYGLVEPVAAFYAGEIISFLELAHTKKYIFHKRLNPENCLIYQNRHLKIQNFSHS